MSERYTSMFVADTPGSDRDRIGPVAHVLDEIAAFGDEADSDAVLCVSLVGVDVTVCSCRSAVLSAHLGPAAAVVRSFAGDPAQEYGAASLEVADGNRLHLLVWTSGTGRAVGFGFLDDTIDLGRRAELGDVATRLLDRLGAGG